MIPESITFGFKILEIPSLEEVEIPMGGLGIASLHKSLRSASYESRWVSRGDPLLTYHFKFFSKEKKPFLSIFDDPFWTVTFEIESPISGLVIDYRFEDSINDKLGLQYEWCKELCLPVILIPNNEPQPSRGNFYTYDRIASTLVGSFYRLPMRPRESCASERLGDWLQKGYGNAQEFYQKALRVLQTRRDSSSRRYSIRELKKTDSGLIDKVQHLRGVNLNFRNKLAHIPERFGGSI